MTRGEGFDLSALDKSLDELARENNQNQNSNRGGRGRGRGNQNMRGGGRGRGGRGGGGGRGRPQGRGGSARSNNSNNNRNISNRGGRGGFSRSVRGSPMKKTFNNNNNNNNNMNNNNNNSFRGRTRGTRGYSRGGMNNQQGRGRLNNGFNNTNQKRVNIQTTGKVIVTNLKPHVTSDDIKTIFESIGTVTQAFVKFDRTSGQSTGSAEVVYAKRQDARRAQKELNGAKIDDGPVYVKLASNAPLLQRNNNVRGRGGMMNRGRGRGVNNHVSNRGRGGMNRGRGRGRGGSGRGTYQLKQHNNSNNNNNNNNNDPINPLQR